MRNNLYSISPLLPGNILAERGRDLTYDAYKGKITPIYGREQEIRQITEILRRRVKRNPILIGEAGVGKTAIIEALALDIVNQQVPEWLQNKKIIAITLFDIIAQAQNYAFGEYAQRLREVIEELKTKPSDQEGAGRIAFFDEIHTLKEYIHGANYLKTALARGEIQLIGATTRDEYRQYIERDPALERRFAPVFISEPSSETTVKILVHLRHFLEKYYKVSISDSAINLAVELAHRYIYERQQPDKSIELLETACVRVLTLASERSFKSRLDDEQIDSELGFGATSSPLPLIVQDEHIRMIVAEWTGIPDSSLSGERQKYLNLDSDLKKRVIGQSEAIKQISQTIMANRAGTVSKPQKPDGVFLFVGTTGVGKTEIAKALATILTGKQDHLVVLDMTGYRESYTIASLIGVPRGNSATPELPTLTKLVRDHPYGVLLLDEIEKAHPELWSLFMPVFEEGELVDRQGATIHFSDMIIIMTANVDMVSRSNERFRREKTKRLSINKVSEAQIWKDIYNEEVLRVVRNDLHFPAEFINRIDQIVVFYPLSQSHVEDILKMIISEMESRLNIKFNITKDAFDFLIKAGYRPEYGARELRRAIDVHIGTQLATMKLKSETDAWDAVSEIAIDLNNDSISLRLEPILSR